MKTAILLMAATCLSAAAASAHTLRLLNWDKYIDPAVLDDFTAETGIKVIYDEYSDAEIIEAFLVSGEADYDLVVVASEYFGRLVATQSIRPLDLERVSGRENLRTELMARYELIEGATQNSLPYLWGTTGIGYDAAAIDERMPDAPTDSWAMVFDPEIVSRFADCGVSLLDAPEEMITVALNYLGHDPASSDPDHLAEAASLITRIAPYVSTFDTEQASRLANGEICLAVAWSGDVLAAAEDQAAGIDITYSVPKEGAPVWFDMFVMPKTAERSDATYAFLEFILRPEVIGRITNHVWYPNPNAASVPYVDAEVLADPSVYPPDEIMELLYPLPSRPGAEKREIARSWRRLKLNI